MPVGPNCMPIATPATVVCQANACLIIQAAFHAMIERSIMRGKPGQRTKTFNQIKGEAGKGFKFWRKALYEGQPFRADSQDRSDPRQLMGKFFSMALWRICVSVTSFL
ncbi:hypothetical protein FHW03_000661 [Ochrobactrum sp. RH2CCR150]|nr:hypothetical protein [Ochrobactrum sp. RH2CCR150]